jgi:hypothetical protein
MFFSCSWSQSSTGMNRNDPHAWTFRLNKVVGFELGNLCTFPALLLRWVWRSSSFIPEPRRAITQGNLCTFPALLLRWVWRSSSFIPEPRRAITQEGLRLP